MSTNKLTVAEWPLFGAVYRRLAPMLDWFLDRWHHTPLVDGTDFAADADWAILQQEPVHARRVVRLSLLAVGGLLLWAAFAEIDEVTRGEGKVIPSSEIQVVQSLDGGIVSHILVRDGQSVEKGQLLLSIDPTRMVSSLRENRAQYLSLLAKAARLRAISDATAFVPPPEVEKEAPELAEQERNLYESRRQELDATVGVARQQLAQRTQELQEVRTKRDQAAQAYELAAKELAVTKPLVQSGAVSEVEILRLQRDVSRFQGERDGATAQLPRIQSAIAEASRKIQEVELGFRNQARAELSETSGKLNSLSAGSEGLQDRVKQTEIRSPVKGTVKQLKVNTVGGVVQPGRDVIEIVPSDDALLLEARVVPRDIAFLRPNQPALVKFTAYDFSVYGGLEATVEQISADTVTDDKGNAFYLVKVRTKHSYLGERRLPIIPGMVAEVDIRTGKKTILSYLLKPVLRAKANALRER